MPAETASEGGSLADATVHPSSTARPVRCGHRLLTAAPAHAERAFVLVNGTALAEFDTDSPATVSAPRAITGLQSGETVVGIDMRPATGQLYGVGSSGWLYLIDGGSGRASAVGSTPLTLSGTRFGVDFNPTVDRLRIVSDASENLRVNPDTGALVLADGALTAGFGVTAAAYTNNFAGATTTTLFDLDTTGDQLLLQNPPNAGMLTAVGPLGVDATAAAAFDISATTGQAFMADMIGGQARLYTVNLVDRRGHAGRHHRRRLPRHHRVGADLARRADVGPDREQRPRFLLQRCTWHGVPARDDHRPPGRRDAARHRRTAGHRRALRPRQHRPRLRGRSRHRPGHGGRPVVRRAQRHGLRVRLQPHRRPDPRRQQRRTESASPSRHGRARGHRWHPDASGIGERRGLHQQPRRRDDDHALRHRHGDRPVADSEPAQRRHAQRGGFARRRCHRRQRLRHLRGRRHGLRGADGWRRAQSVHDHPLDRHGAARRRRCRRHRRCAGWPPRSR